MKIRVNINGILEAEAEFEAPGSVSALGAGSWTLWEADHHKKALQFIAQCSEQAVRIIQATPQELDATETQ